MLGIERRLKILERMAEDPTLYVSDLAVAFDVSEMTIRRDMARLESDGFLRRTHGGATVHLTRSLDLALNARLLSRAKEKRLIGMAAVRLVEGVRALYVGIGTTAEQFARYLPDDPDLTVVTGSLPIASLLGTRALRVVALGGTILRHELSFVGPAAEVTLERYRFDAAIIGAAGLAAGAGLTEGTEEEAAVNRRATELARRVIVIADGTKIGTVSFAAVVPADRVDVLVTDVSAPADELDALRVSGVQVIVAAAPVAPSPDAAPPALVHNPSLAPPHPVRSTA
jgi:DeoR/GlpR family transcriptional regulator of sugar metabolism